jgi:SPP1 gp7 family putative phage head morphogenesis protein
MTFLESIRNALVPTRVEVIEAETKAVTGRGAWVMEHHTPLGSTRRTGTQWMKRAQEISRTNPWIDRAERVIAGRGAGVPFHLEDAEGETIDDQSPDALRAVMKFMERPNPRMTRRQLWSITLRHMGVCNHAFWFLDQRDALAGTPLAAYYINPGRMTAARDKAGNVTGWVLDAESEYQWGMGTPLSIEEVLHFEMEPSDWPELGGGLVEAAEIKALLSGAADRFAVHTLNSGGRRGHFIGPREGRMDDDVFQSLVNGLRSAADDPEAAKRNIVTKGPIEATPQASTPRELEASAVMSLTRDDILALWNCPPSQIGVPAPAGLNSGSTKSYDEAALWQNAIGPRLDAFTETVQYQLLDRWAQLGIDLQLVTDRPEFDDRAPAFELFVKSLDAPMRNKERRALLGLDPTGDDRFDNEIWMPARLSPVVAIDDEGNVIEDPEPTPTPPPPPVPDEEALLEVPDDPAAAGKAVVRSPFGRLRQATERQVPSLTRSVAAALSRTREDVLRKLKAKAGHLAGKPDDVDAWWTQKTFTAEMTKALQRDLNRTAAVVATEATRILDKPKKADFDDAVLDFVRSRGGERITGMADTTRDAVLRAIRPILAEAAEEGTAPLELSKQLTDAVGDLAIWSEERAEMIARTETALAYNDAALSSYREYGVDEVEAIDGDDDPECAERDGKRYPLAEALSITDHPNGTLDWVPVV